ncbi:MAG: glycosyltransferase, partial [Ilumatobacter sp.]
MLDRLPRPTFRRAPSAPSMSLVLAVYDPPIDALQEQLDAVAAQSSSDWECIAVDDASTDPNVAAVLARWASIDPDRRRVITREKNGGIAAASNDGLDAAHGEFVGFIDHDDVLHEEAVAAVIAHFAQHREHGVVHTDEQTVDARGAVIAAYHKPDWSPRRHLGHHYLAHFVAARRSAIGGLRVLAEFEPSQDYDFYLRVIEAAERMGLTVGHIPRILYSWRAIAGSSARDASEKPEMVEAVRRCVAAALERRGDEARAELVEYRGAPTTSCRLVRSVPDVSFAAVPISTGTLPAEVNTAIAESDAEVICLVDDPGVQDADWAGQLIALSSVAGVGVAGPKIVDADTDTLLSSGRVVQPRLEDQFVGEPADSSGPWGSLFVEREVSAIAPLGLTVRRALFEQVGPLAEDVDLDAAVAEFCARVIASDHDVVWTPHVTLSVSASFGPGAGLFDPDRADERERDDAIVAARSPEPRRERFDPFGVGQHDGRHENAHTYARRLLHAGEVDLVTSDVFDTLVTRPVATPSDLFLRLAESPDVSGTVSPNVFAHARRDAEFRARRDRADGRRRQMRADGHDDIAIAEDPDVAAPEVGMHEIYERMPASFGNLEALRERELVLEGRTLVPIPETVAVFELAHQLGIPVVLVSDIYLTSEELTAVLSSAGLDLSLVDEVVTSLDHRCGKAHGLLDETIARRRVQPERVVHLG